MTKARAWAGILFFAIAVAGPSPGTAQDDGRKALALDLARVMVDDSLRQGLEDQVTTTLIAAVTRRLQDQLNRRLQDKELRMIASITKRFVAETLPPARTEELAAAVYMSQFNEAELRELLTFQRSAIGRKSTRLAPVIAAQTAQAIDDEIRKSPALPRMVDELQQAFPVLKSPESP